MRADHGQKERQIRRLTSVLATDICGYSALSERDERVAVETVQRVRAALDKTVDKFGGRIFHQAGDGFLAEFSSANDSLLAALDLLEAIGDLEQKAPHDPIEVRVGLHVGDVVDQPNGDLLGHGVNIAARLQQLAHPGEILASVNLVNLVSSRQDVDFRKRGSLQLKNIQKPLVAFDITPARKRGYFIRRIINPVLKRPAISTLMSFLIVGVVGLAISQSAGSDRDSTTLQDQEQVSTIDRLAIRSATEVLIGANKPVDAAISALLATGSFEKAVAFIESEHKENRAKLTAGQSVNLLHQAGALAFDRDMQTAQGLYRQILALHPSDWVAAAQLARIYHRRSEKNEAASLIALALKDSMLTERQRLRLEIDEARILSSGFHEASEKLQNIARAAESAGYTNVSTLADRYALTNRRLSISATRPPTQGEITELMADLNRIILRQQEAGLSDQLVQSYNEMGNLNLELANYASALEAYESAFEIESVLQRPRSQLFMLSNIARVHLNLGNPDEAERFNESAIDVAAEYDLVSTSYFNKGIEAEIAFARNDPITTCLRLEEANYARPKDRTLPDHLLDLSVSANCSNLK